MNTTRDLGKLLRLVFGGAAAAVARRLNPRRSGRRGNAGGRSWEDGAWEDLASRCRRAIRAAATERDRLVAEILKYDRVREILIAREATEPDDDEREGLRRSLNMLDDRLAAWLDDYDALTARIAELESDLAFLDEGAAGAESRTQAHAEGPAVDADTAQHLAALELRALPASLMELKAAYRARLKVVHPDVGAQPSTQAAAAATVAFAELRKRLLHS